MLLRLAYIQVVQYMTKTLLQKDHEVIFKDYYDVNIKSISHKYLFSPASSSLKLPSPVK